MADSSVYEDAGSWSGAVEGAHAGIGGARLGRAAHGQHSRVQLSGRCWGGQSGAGGAARQQLLDAPSLPRSKVADGLQYSAGCAKPLYCAELASCRHVTVRHRLACFEGNSLPWGQLACVILTIVTDVARVVRASVLFCYRFQYNFV